MMLESNSSSLTQPISRRRKLPSTFLLVVVATSCYLATTSQAFNAPSSIPNKVTSLLAVQVNPRTAAPRKQATLPTKDRLDESSAVIEALWQLNEYQVKYKSEAENISASEESNEESPREERSSQPPPEDSGSENEEDTESAASGNSDQDSSRAENARKLAAHAALLGSRKGSTKGRRTTTSKTKATSVGARRVGSASKARQGTGMQERIMDALRKSASSNTIDTSEQKSSEDDSSDNSSTKASITSNNFTPTPTSKKLTSSSIHSAVSELMQQQLKRRMDEYSSYNSYAEQKQQQLKRWSQDDYAKFFGWQRQPPEAGRILIPPTTKPRGDAKLQFPECLTLRVATSKEDIEIANLRLSVFSNFTPEVRKQLVSRSVRSVISRRVQGATCIVATVPPSIQARKRNKAPVIVGSAECSFHEFDDTRLGRRRLPQSILYITEVAVNPSARRRGIGAKLLEVRRDGCVCLLLGGVVEIDASDIELMFLTNLTPSPLCEGCGYPRQCAGH